MDHLNGRVTGAMFAGQTTIHGNANFNMNTCSETTNLAPNEPFCFGVHDPTSTFVGRDEQLDEIKEAMKLSGPLVFSNATVVLGGGGVGKTELVRKFIRDHVGSNVKFVIWFEASTHNSLNSTVKLLSESFFGFVSNIVGTLENELDAILAKFYSEICRSDSLLIFDNAEAFRDEPGMNDGIERYLPKTIRPPLQHPKIIITTRRSSGWDPAMKLIKLDGFTDGESERFLSNQLSDIIDVSENWGKLSSYFGNLPVALQYSVAMIRREKKLSCRYSVSQFLREVSSHQLFSPDSNIFDCPPNLCNLWAQTFKKLEKVYQFGNFALELLQLISCLSPDGIPKSFIHQALNGVSSNSTTRTYREGLHLLQSLSFVKINSEEKLIIHRLLQTYSYHCLISIHDHLSNEQYFNKISKNILEIIKNSEISINDSTVIRNLSSFVEASKMANAAHDVQKLHLQVARIIQPTNFASASRIVRTLHDRVETYNHQGLPSSLSDLHVDIKHFFADILKEEGKYEEALQNYTQVLGWKRTNLGDDDPSTLLLTRSIALVHESQGQYLIALELLLKVHKAQQVLLKSNHPDELETRNFIARVYKCQGKFQDALETYKQVYKSQCQILGQDHANSIQTNHNIAVVYIHLAKYDEAESIYSEIYRQNIKFLGPEHATTLNTQEYLATVYDSQGKYKEALEIYTNIYRQSCDILGPDHPSTILRKYLIALVQDNQGRHQDSLQVYNQVYNSLIPVLGPTNPHVIAVQHNMGRVHLTLGNYSMSMKISEEVVNRKRQVYGDDHPNTLMAEFMKGVVYKCQGDHVKAMSVYENILHRLVTAVGEHHPHVLEVKESMSAIYEAQGKYEDAASIFDTVYNRKCGILGDMHPSTILTRQNFAAVRIKQGNFKEGFEIFQSAYAQNHKLLGPNHPSTILTRKNIASCYDQQGDLSHSLEIYKDVLAAECTALGENHPCTLDTRRSIASLLSRLKKPKEALEILNQVHTTARDSLGEDHPTILSILENINSAYMKQRKYAKALAGYNELRRKQRKILGEDHPETLTTCNNIGVAHTKLKNYKEALESYQQVYLQKCRIYGPHHPSTLLSRYNVAIWHETQGLNEEALKIYQDIYEQQCKNFGSHHPDAEDTKSRIEACLPHNEPQGLEGPEMEEPRHRTLEIVFASACWIFDNILAPLPPKF